VQEITLDELLARHIEHVDAHDVESQRLIPRYEALRDAIRDRSPTSASCGMAARGALSVLGNDPRRGRSQASRPRPSNRRAGSGRSAGPD
jgi:hypothetical protein